jgi:FMN phosphatase YigB (HAD superfamily)
MMHEPARVVFLFDVDNTLLDNDRFSADLDACLALHLGAAGRTRYRTLYAALRDETGYADYLGTLQRLRRDCPDDVALSAISAFMLDYPFAERLYPGAFDALAHCARAGPTGILSDGDIVFQPRKMRRSGIAAAVGGRIMITLHKEQRPDRMRARFPAAHHVMVDDKPRVLAAMKAALGDALTTVFVRQGHYALDPANSRGHAAPDVTLEAIGEMTRMDPAAWIPGHDTA